MKIFEIFNMPKDNRSIVPCSLLADSTVLLGVEVELEGCTVTHNTLDKTSKYWTAVDDNSLRNNGVELIFSVPLGGVDVVDAAHEFDTILKTIESKQGTSVVTSHRTSTHVHMDCRGLELNDIHKIITMFACLESSLYTISGKDRYENIYCPGLSSCTDQVEKLSELFTQPHRYIKDRVRQFCKYSGVNLLSLMNKGSLEFRGHTAVTSSDVLLRWINTLLRLRSESLKYRSAKEIVTECCRTSPDIFISGIMGDSFCTAQVMENHALYCENNLLNALDIVYKNGASKEAHVYLTQKEDTTEVTSFVAASTKIFSGEF